MFKLLFVLLLIAIVMVIIVLGIFINDSIKSYQEKTKSKKQVKLADKLNSVCNDGFEEIKKELKEIFKNDFVVKQDKSYSDFPPYSLNTFLTERKEKEIKKVENAGLYGVPKDNKMTIRIKGFILRLDVDIAMGTLKRINSLEIKIEECEYNIKTITLEFDDKLKSLVECNHDLLKEYMELKNVQTNRLIRLKKTLSDYENDLIEEYRKDEN